MGKWANGKLKVEHVAAAQGGGEGRGEREEQLYWASVLRSVLSSFWGGVGRAWGRGGSKRWHVNSLCELLRCAELVCGFGVSLEC